MSASTDESSPIGCSSTGSEPPSPELPNRVAINLPVARARRLGSAGAQHANRPD
jgi:hypothetical protein